MRFLFRVSNASPYKISRVYFQRTAALLVEWLIGYDGQLVEVAHPYACVTVMFWWLRGEDTLVFVRDVIDQEQAARFLGAPWDAVDELPHAAVDWRPTGADGPQ